MNSIVIFGSRYGSTKNYAEEFARRHNLDAISFDMILDLSEYDMIIYFGSLFAGNPYGLKKTAKMIQPSQKLIVVTVGLSDPSDQANADYIKETTRSVLPDSLADKTPIYHLRGDVDYKKMKALHRFMMYFVYLKAKSDDTEESRHMVETYGDKLCLTDYDTLDIIEF